MSYQEFIPSPGLRELVDRYWVFEGEESSSVERIFPDGSMDIIFSLIENTPPKVVGMMTTFSDICLPDSTIVFGIRFKPGMFHTLTPCPLYELRDTQVEARLILPQISALLREQLIKQVSLPDKIRAIECILGNHQGVPRTNHEKIIQSCMQEILVHQGKKHISEIAKNHCINLRSLERKFIESVGINMKEMSQIIRFQETLKTIQKNPKTDLLHIAFQHGYYDHSHLCNEFRKFSGYTPSTFR